MSLGAELNYPEQQEEKDIHGALREKKIKWWPKREETLGKIWKHFRGT